MTIQEEVPAIRRLIDAPVAQQAIASEIRAEMARQRVTEVDVADALGHNQQWFNRRSRGIVPFSGAEVWLIEAFLNKPDGHFFQMVRHQGLEPRTRWLAFSPAPEHLADVVQLRPRRHRDNEVPAALGAAA